MDIRSVSGVLLREKGQDEQQIICTYKSSVSAVGFAVVKGPHMPYSPHSEYLIFCEVLGFQSGKVEVCVFLWYGNTSLIEGDQSPSDTVLSVCIMISIFQNR